MAQKNFKEITDENNLEHVVALCREALECLGRNGTFRSRVLLEMVLIQLATDAAKNLAPDKLNEAAAG